MVKQRPSTDGTIAIDCGVCPVAMLTDLPYEKVLADIPHYRATSHHDWMQYFNVRAARGEAAARRRLARLGWCARDRHQPLDFLVELGHAADQGGGVPVAGTVEDLALDQAVSYVSTAGQYQEIPQDQAAAATGCRSLAPMMMSHSMMASSPNITGKTQLETLCSYCGHNMPVTLVAR